MTLIWSLQYVDISSEVRPTVFACRLLVDLFLKISLRYKVGHKVDGYKVDGYKVDGYKVDGYKVGRNYWYSSDKSFDWCDDDFKWNNSSCRKKNFLFA